MRRPGAPLPGPPQRVKMPRRVCARRREKIQIRVRPRHVRGRTHFSACKCGICPRNADQSCARQAATPFRKGGRLFGKFQAARSAVLRAAVCASKPVSRVLSFKTAIYLDAPSPVRSSRLPGTAGPACMSLHGVAPDRVYSDGRLARRRVSSYLAFPPLPGAGKPRRRAVYLCCTFPRVAPGGCYPLSLPCGARTFLTGGPFAPPARLSSLLAKGIVPYPGRNVKPKRQGTIEISCRLGYNRAT